jgi:hypothetical protein
MRSHRALLPSLLSASPFFPLLVLEAGCEMVGGALRSGDDAPDLHDLMPIRPSLPGAEGTPDIVVPGVSLPVEVGVDNATVRPVPVTTPDGPS